MATNPRHIMGRPQGFPNFRQRRLNRAWTRKTAEQQPTLNDALGALPSLPRPVLNRLVSHLIERMDDLDGDPDNEQDDHGGGAMDDEGEALTWPTFGAQWELGE